MNINKKVVIILAIIVSFSWVGNIYLFKSNRFDEFIFLDHYMDVVITNKLLAYDDEYVAYFNSLPEYAQRNAAYTQIEDINIYYIKDIYNDIKIESIKFPEISNDYLEVREDVWKSENSNTNVVKLWISANNINYEDKYDLVKLIKEKDTVISKVIYKTSDKKEYEVNVGELHLDYKENYVTEKPGNSGLMDEAVDIKLDTMETYFKGLVNDNYEFYTYEDGNKETIVNVPYSTEGRYVFDIYVRSKNNAQENINQVMNMNVEFKGETSLGEPYCKTIWLNNINATSQRFNIEYLLDSGNKPSEIREE